MKFSKLGVMFAAATIAAGAFADAANVLITFSTDGDTYADGTDVKVGEWYALCWAGDGEFDGLTLDCTPVNDAEKVLRIGPFAQVLDNGKVGCRPRLFQIDSAVAPKGGSYFVYLLDTRTVEGDKVVVAAKNAETGLPKSVNGAVGVRDYTASAAVGSNVASASDAEAKWAESAVTGEITTAKIESINIVDAKVEINVVGMMPGLMYNVKMGDDPKNLKDYVIEMPKTGTSATFEADREDAKFFKVVRWPVAE